MTKEAPDPSGLGHELLLEWAQYASGDHKIRRRQGFPAEWSVKHREDRAHDGTPPDRWYVVEKIVANNIRTAKRIWPIFAQHFLGGAPFWLIAKERDKSEYSIKTTICWTCELVRREYVDSGLDIPRKVA